jgi:glycosyltransferase involved in cell wall biosynthesis
MSTRIAFISWTAYSRRSESVANALGAAPIYIQIWKECCWVLLPIRYVLQGVRTWRVLRRIRPAIIGTMNPPILLPLLVWAYSRVYKVRFFMDSHTGALVGSRWGRFKRLHRFLSRRALTTIVTNPVLAAEVSGWGAPTYILELEIPEFEPPEATSPCRDGSVVVINSFSSDEPLEAVLEAATMLPESHVYITGRVPAALAPSLAQSKPENVTYTDYLTDSDYLRLLYHAQAIMVLVTVDHTLLQGAAEAVAVGKPLITSDWPVLREYFRRGALYVDNTPPQVLRARSRLHSVTTLPWPVRWASSNKN